MLIIILFALVIIRKRRRFSKTISRLQISFALPMIVFLAKNRFLLLVKHFDAACLRVLEGRNSFIDSIQKILHICLDYIFHVHGLERFVFWTQKFPKITISWIIQAEHFISFTFVKLKFHKLTVTACLCWLLGLSQNAQHINRMSAIPGRLKSAPVVPHYTYTAVHGRIVGLNLVDPEREKNKTELSAVFILWVS